MWLGTHRRWQPGYWHGLAWGDFHAYLLDARRELNELARSRPRHDGDVPDYVEGGYPDPDADEFRGIPWAGEGPDPLEELWGAS